MSSNHAHNQDCDHDHKDHGHGHGHGHGHHAHAYPLGIALNAAYVVLELGAAWWLSSTSLAADALHNIGDIGGLAASWLAIRLARTLANRTHTYGYRRWSILIAILNAGLLLVAMGGIGWEAIQRLGNPPLVNGLAVSAVAATGFVMNALTALLFLRATELNARAAFWHMAADAGVSLSVAISGLAIWFFGWTWCDPVTSLLVVVVVAYSTIHLLRDAVGLASDKVPPHIDSHAVRSWLMTQPNVTAIHDLHIWAISSTETALTVHLTRDVAVIDDGFLHSTANALRAQFNIHHSTLQIEHGDPDHVCPLTRENMI